MGGNIPDTGAQTRDHASGVAAVGRVEVLLCAVEDQDHALSATVVELCTVTEAVDLTPAQAREVARILNSLTTAARVHQ